MISGLKYNILINSAVLAPEESLIYKPTKLESNVSIFSMPILERFTFAYLSRRFISYSWNTSTLLSSVSLYFSFYEIPIQILLYLPFFWKIFLFNWFSY